MKTGLYVHVPFCETKCGYCDFYSVPLRDRRTSPLVRAIVRELDQRQPSIPEAISTIFVGGGTPTVLPFDEMALLFGRLAQIAKDHPLIEFTTEANPATVDERRISLLAGGGVNRISFGGQSFHQGELDVLERLHDPKSIAVSIELARRGGIEQINLDLMFGIPGQSMASWRESLQRAIDLNTDHLACYGLTYESGTPMIERLNQGVVSRCDNHLEADMYLMCIAFLADHGYEQYEISNFAKPGCECKHNLIYWSNGPYLGVGPSAASYLNGNRVKNESDIKTYIRDIEHDRPAWRDSEKLTGKALAGETAMLQLRMNRGIDIARFEAQVGLNPLELYRQPLQEYSEIGKIEIGEGVIRLTDAGRLIADRIISELLTDTSQGV